MHRPRSYCHCVAIDSRISDFTAPFITLRGSGRFHQSIHYPANRCHSPTIQSLHHGDDAHFTTGPGRLGPGLATTGLGRASGHHLTGILGWDIWGLGSSSIWTVRAGPGPGLASFRAIGNITGPGSRARAANVGSAPGTTGHRASGPDRASPAGHHRPGLGRAAGRAGHPGLASIYSSNLLIFWPAIPASWPGPLIRFFSSRFQLAPIFFHQFTTQSSPGRASATTGITGIAAWPPGIGLGSPAAPRRLPAAGRRLHQSFINLSGFSTGPVRRHRTGTGPRHHIGLPTCTTIWAGSSSASHRASGAHHRAPAWAGPGTGLAWAWPGANSGPPATPSAGSNTQ